MVLELDASARITDKLNIKGMLSVGDRVYFGYGITWNVWISYKFQGYSKID